MPDVIQLLPDAIANQIAAGEVIQRPASVVKELLENAIDAGATEIHLELKDAGKTLIRVSDNGSGMSETDARLALERHATSKIRSADDLFRIHTLGFRGEALASIASIAHLDLKTRPHDQEVGTQLIVEGSKVVSQEPVSCKPGTVIAIKNLFFNVPARRKFLKTDAVEQRHIIDEFERVALPNPDLLFSLTHNGNEIFHLPPGTFRQRIVGIFGKRYNEKVVPVEESTDIVEISGFITKPEAARKTRGEQFFFVNERFIKSAYLHHAVGDALSELIPGDAHPGYFLKLTVDPAAIDVNIHPTKTEIKFEDERAIYALLRSAVRQSIGKFNVTPSLDFEQETSFQVPLKPTGPIQVPQVSVNPEYNPFDPPKQASGPARTTSPQERHNRENWEALYTGVPETTTPQGPAQADMQESEESESASRVAFQLHGKFILAQIKSGMAVIHQSRAHERILYETNLKALEEQSVPSQQQLFPQTLQFDAKDASLVKELLGELQHTGIDIREFGQHSFIVQGLPLYAAHSDPQTLLEGVLEHYKNSLQELRLEPREAFARSLARKTAIPAGTMLEQDEMLGLIDALFACKNPYTSPSGKPIIHTFTLSDLDKKFDS